MTSQVYPRLRGERQLFPEIPRRIEHRANDAGANGEVAEAFTGAPGEAELSEAAIARLEAIL